jgi:hypothetical protein
MIRIRHVDGLGWWEMQMGGEVCFPNLPHAGKVFLCFAEIKFL